MCVSDTLSVNLPTGQTPQRIFIVDSLKDADLRKDVHWTDSEFDRTYFLFLFSFFVLFVLKAYLSGRMVLYVL